MNKITIKINEQEVLFAHLKLAQEICALHHFSFEYHIEEANGITIDTYKKFYADTLSQKVSIINNDRLIFEGVIQKITCINQFDYYINFKIEGQCNASLLDQHTHCQSFHNQKLKDIFNQLIQNKIAAEVNPIAQSEIKYTVQYNMSDFEMLQLLCIKHGEWMYYAGDTLYIKRPDQNPIPLKYELSDLFDVQLNAALPKDETSLTSYDFNDSNLLKLKYESDIKLSLLAQTVVDTKATQQAALPRHTINATKEDILKNYAKLKTAETLSHNIILKCKTRHSNILLGSTIEIINNEKSEGIYTIVKIEHNAEHQNHYYNQLTAIPIENEFPPYVNPDAQGYCPQQYAIVTSNEDTDGLSRVKVRFNWQEDDQESPWLQVMVPHAGNGKGFRFLPEIDDEVLVQFIGNNPDAPFVAGAIYSNKNKIAIDETGNHIKTIQTRSNRKIEFNDNDGLITISDKSNSGNAITLNNGNNGTKTEIETGGSDNKLIIHLNQPNGIKIAVVESGTNSLSINLNKQNKTLELISEKEINLTAGNKLTVSSNEISIIASKKIDITTEELNINSNKSNWNTGQNLTINAGTEAKINSLNTDITASGQLSLIGGGSSVLQGGIVRIN